MARYIVRRIGYSLLSLFLLSLTKDGEHALTDAAKRYRLLEPPRRARAGRPLRERG